MEALKIIPSSPRRARRRYKCLLGDPDTRVRGPRSRCRGCKTGLPQWHLQLCRRRRALFRRPYPLACVRALAATLRRSVRRRSSHTPGDRQVWAKWRVVRCCSSPKAWILARFVAQMSLSHCGVVAPRQITESSTTAGHCTGKCSSPRLSHSQPEGGAESRDIAVVRSQSQDRCMQCRWRLQAQTISARRTPAQMAPKHCGPQL